VSAYQLTYAEGTPLWRDLRAGRIRRLSEDDEHALFRRVHETLTALGYPAYEVSNFSLGDAHRSRHNSKYWTGSPYIGLGPAAHSFLPRTQSHPASSSAAHSASHSMHSSMSRASCPRVARVSRRRSESGGSHGRDGRVTRGQIARDAAKGSDAAPDRQVAVRSWNVATLDDYVARIQAGQLPEAGRETLSDPQLADETILLALRTTDGLDLAVFRERFGRDLAERNRRVIDRAVANGFWTLDRDRLRPTLDGLAVADRLAAELA
jgi:coproporphyrinogen III oxidase-like Fe-S oxidoreductase